MGWYDFFSRFYDSSLEALYRDARTRAADALDLGRATRVLDVPTGTGQSLDTIVERLAPGGRVLGVDLSEGMLGRARRRAEAAGYAERVVLEEGDVHALDADRLERVFGERTVDRLHVFLGMTAFPRHEEAFESLFDLLAPGGRAVVVDTYAEKPGLQGRMVNLVAGAEIRRRAWEPLERLSRDFERVELPPNPKYGGALWLATGVRAG